MSRYIQNSRDGSSFPTGALIFLCGSRGNYFSFGLFFGLGIFHPIFSFCLPSPSIDSAMGSRNLRYLTSYLKLPRYVARLLMKTAIHEALE